ncbi:MAG: hypothetical protein V4751_14840 [Pseudomonadota bacterium]
MPIRSGLALRVAIKEVGDLSVMVSAGQGFEDGMQPCGDSIL